MAILVSCVKGHELKISDKFAGKRVKCPKCQSVIEVPEDEPEILEPVVIDSPIDGVPEFGQGADSQSDWLASVPPAPSQSIFPQAAAVPSHPKPTTSSPKKPQPIPKAAGLSTGVLVATCVAAAFGFLSVCFIGWLLLGPSETDSELLAFSPPDTATSVAMAPTEPKPTEPKPTNSRPTDSRPNGYSTVTTEVRTRVFTQGPNGVEIPYTPPASEPIPTAPATVATTPTSPTPTAPAKRVPTQSTPAKNIVAASNGRDLRQVDFDNLAECFQFPKPIFASAYDELSGKFAITNDELGIVFYDLDDCLNGKTAPLKVFPTVGRPQSICLKPMRDKRLFVYCESETTTLHVIDADTLEQTNEIIVQDAAQLGFVNASGNPVDPYLYFTFGESVKMDVTENSDPTWFYSYDHDRLSRVNLENGEQGVKSKLRALDFELSQSGDQIFVRSPNYDSVGGTWEVISELTDTSKNRYGSKPVAFTNFDDGKLRTPIYKLKDSVSIGQTVYSLANTIGGGEFRPSKSTDFQPHQQFDNLPLVFGFGKKSLVFASPNNFKQIQSIPIPKTWQLTDGDRSHQEISNFFKGHRDFRYRSGICDRYVSAFYQPFADNTRKLALVWFDRHLVVVPVDRLNLPEEQILSPNFDLLKTARAGETIEFPLHDNKDVKFELLFTRKGLEDKRIPILGTETPLEFGPESQRGSDNTELALAAEVDEGQKVLILRDDFSRLLDLKPRSFPFPVRVGEERMMAIRYERQRAMLHIQRTMKIRHPVTEVVEILRDDDPQTLPSMPTIDNGVFRWTPSLEHVGMQNIRIRATLGDTDREWIWPIEITSPVGEMKFDFYVQGISTDFGATNSVIWGKSFENAKPRYMHDTERERTPSILGIIETATGKMLKQIPISDNIISAAIHPTGVYVNTSQFDPNRGVNQNSLVRLDSTTLKPIATKENLGSGIARVIADDYLILDRLTEFGPKGNWYDSAYKIPEMTKIDFPATAYNEPPTKRFGRLKDGWVIDGVVWDSKLKNRRLLLSPNISPSFRNRVETSDGFFRSRTDGPSVGTWNQTKTERAPRYQLRDLDVSVAASKTSLGLFSEAPLDSRGGENTPQLIPLSSAKSDAPQDMISQLMESRLAVGDWLLGSVSENDNHVLAAVNGNVYSLPKSLIRVGKPRFTFNERQEKLVLDGSKANSVRYSAPGASSYKISVWYDPKFEIDSFGDGLKAPDITMDSNDGKFELKFDEPKLAMLALQTAKDGPNGRDHDESQALVIEHIKSITKQYKELTGKAPKTIPVVVKVLVQANQEKSEEKAGLFHSYLVEPSIKSIQAALQDRGTRNR